MKPVYGNFSKCCVFAPLLLTPRDAALLNEAVSFADEIMLPWVVGFQERLAAVEIECRFYHLTTALLCTTLRFIGGSSKA